MATVYLRKDESVEQLIKRFKKACIKENIIGEYKKHEFYESKGQIARREKEQAERKYKKKR